MAAAPVDGGEAAPEHALGDLHQLLQPPLPPRHDCTAIICTGAVKSSINGVAQFGAPSVEPSGGADRGAPNCATFPRTFAPESSYVTPRRPFADRVRTG